jgi:hypothetical protein
VATPKSSRLAWLRRSGLIAPDEIAAQSDFVPLDFTRLNSRELGAVHSRYAVRHSHGLFELAKLNSELASLEYDLRMAKAQLRVLHGGKFKNKWMLDDEIELDEDVAEFNKRISRLEDRRHIVDGIVKGYEGLARAASREMSRRISEQAPKD